MRPLPKLLAMIALLAGLAAASAWSVRLACADYWFRQETVRGTERAIAVTPGQSALYVRLAVLESEESNRKATEALQRAVALNPADGLSWVELGLRYDTEGNARDAEQCLLRAAAEDKQYLPRWTLANYYFRRSDVGSFWVWAKESAAMVTGDPLPLFRLCGRVAEDGNLINRLQIGRPDVCRGYVSYLLGQNRLDLIGPSSLRLLEGNRESDVPVLLTTCDRLLENKRVEEALEIWNRLADARRISVGRMPTPGGNLLTNGDFAMQPTSQGFDWRLQSFDGVSPSSEENPAGLRVTFSGRQTERGEPLIQFAPVQENTEYTLRFRFGTSGIRPGAGLHWRIADMNGAILREGESLSSEGEAQRDNLFRTPAGCRLVRLSLNYERVPGTTRIEGFIVLRNVEFRSGWQLR